MGGRREAEAMRLGTRVAPTLQVQAAELAWVPQTARPKGFECERLLWVPEFWVRFQKELRGLRMGEL